MKMWEMPRINVEEFEANEYVAACGEGHTVYNFTCDAGEGGHGPWYAGAHYYKVYKDDGTQVGFNYSPCGTTHEADSEDDFYAGYMDDKSTQEIEHISVIIWRGENNDNCHCTTNLDKSSWTTAKS